MKIKTPLLFLAILVFISMVVNSCKKDNSGSIQTLFTNGTWQLATVMVFNYVGSSQVGSADTLNTTCDTTQYFTFNSNNTCTYTNFDCITQPKASGTWSLSSDQRFLMADMTCQDTITGSKPSTGKPFAYAQIYNLGQYSMVLQTGDIATYYTSTTKRTIIQYGFVRQSAPSGN